MLSGRWQAALAVIALCACTGPPTLEEQQQEFLSWKFGLFLHFNMGTFTGEEWATPHGDPSTFAPLALDAEQWAETAVAANIEYAVLTVKHHDGFALWNSAATEYDVGASAWLGGGGDVVRAYADAMRARGIHVGLYFSIWDRTNGDENGLPDLALVQDQLTELLTSYGPIALLWFDGWGWQEHITYDRIPYNTVRAHVRDLQPQTLVLENNHEHSLEHSDIVIYERNVTGTPLADNTLPAEVADNIRADGKWFYSAGACDLKAADDLRASLAEVNASGANYLLDLTPDREGKIPECQVELVKQLR